ncbi:MAG: polysaccharide biosynthesis tyrosine autokinase [Candidatus Hydrogenedentota bacterium]|nr:MAG: polysaccharide biosynthesis tyrosine autokinase [Candidatus Hydrogenedentota bacterium]
MSERFRAPGGARGSSGKEAGEGRRESLRKGENLSGEERNRRRSITRPQKTYELDLVDYWRILKRRWWIVALSFVVIMVFTYIHFRTLVPLYRAQANLEVTKAIATEGMERWFYYKGHPIETAMKQITSRACVEAALRDLGEITDSSSEYEINGKVNAVIGALNVTEIPNTNIITVSMAGPDKDRLPKVVNAICRVYQRLEKEWDRRSDDEVIEFLESRIEQYRKRLEAAEANMVAFQEKNLDVAFSDNVLAQLKLRSDLSIEAARLEEELHEMEIDHRWLENYPDPVLDSLKNERKRLMGNLERLRRNFTDYHPSVAELLERKKELDRRIEEQRRRSLEERRQRWERVIRQKRSRLEEVRRQLSGIEEMMQSLPKNQVIRANLQMELDLSKKLYSMFWQRLEQQKIIRQSKSGGVVLQGPAGEAVKIFPNEKTHFSMGVALALLVGLAAAFVWEVLDTSIRTIEEVEDFVGLPVLGVIPRVLLRYVEVAEEDEERFPGKPRAHDAGTVIYYEPRFPISEAFRGLASSLEFTFFNEGHRTLLVASATPQEGKTTTVSNLGIALAFAGKRTILLDANLRHPGITKSFQLSGHTGLSEVLEGLVPWKAAVYPTMIDKLDIVPTGSLPGRPAELLKTALEHLLKDLTLVYDAVLVDCPPILPVADASIIAAMAGGTLLVYSQGHAPREVLIRARAKLETARGRVIGIVLNKVPPEGELGKNYYSHYYYYPTEGEQKRAS